jgi:hypothetical protein
MMTPKSHIKLKKKLLLYPPLTNTNIILKNPNQITNKKIPLNQPNPTTFKKKQNIPQNPHNHHLSGIKFFPV